MVFCALLWQILRKCPELVPNVFGDEHSSDVVASFTRPWSRVKLSSAIRRLTTNNISTRFCFFIDGLDEFEGDQWELIEDLNSLVSPNLKLCLSSRPWNVFVEEYGQSDLHLALDRLTHQDMAQYVRDVLIKDSKFLRLAAREPEATDKLVDEIRLRADGVFLWTHLVVQSLRRGLREPDDIEMLFRRLRALPTDLKTFFRRMIDVVDEVYKPYTARALQIALHAFEPLPPDVFTFLPKDVDDPNFAFRDQYNAMSTDDVRDCRRNINKWCRDLLEIRSYELPAFSVDVDGVATGCEDEGGVQPSVAELLKVQKVHEAGHVTVEFLHRTVKDFLETSEMTYSKKWLGLASIPGRPPRDSSLCALRGPGLRARVLRL
ncbi:hypothetical protein LTR97_010653 [Elasticomyces elasticus]|uniref:NACHT domain-containing protein n=1 Tax=Elasticomyces elasticus TaxID=574655 RepID=A0AAN7ZWQ8_9PEZI|nr:hypothetical protein LTR97_010653 [Elasticomyces elasticus]